MADPSLNATQQSSHWHSAAAGATLGTKGSEGLIILDEEHNLGARITLERNGATAPFSITCGVYGWMVHTRFFSSESDANTEYERMKTALEELLSARPADNRTGPFHDRILAFVQAFP